MALDDAASLLAVFADHDLLPKAQVDEVRALAGPFPKAANLARELARRGVLTPFQVNEIFQGRASGLVLGQYLLLERLGAGGMGQVYKARHRVLDRLVALKVIRAEFVSRPDAVERFRRECRAAARLSHPNIILVHDAHQAGAVHFLAMEYVDGKDLGRVLKERGPLPTAEACEYARQAALGLQHAHERGLVHRDVKPANLILTADGMTVKVLDLGLARLRADSGSAPAADSGLTQDGVVMGTPDYLAPEQAGGDSALADVRADVYSLGCTLYHLLAGEPPFPGKTLREKLTGHLCKEPAPLEGRRPDLPAGLAAVVRRMTAKEPAARYQTPGEVAAALQPFCRTARGPAPAPPAPPAVSDPMTPTVTHAPMPATVTYASPPRTKGGKLLVWTVVGAAILAVFACPGLVLWLGWLLFAPPLVQSRPAANTATANDPGPPSDKDGGPGPVVVPVAINLPPPPKQVAVRDGLVWPPPECVALLGDVSGRHWGDIQCVAFHPNGKLIATSDHIGGQSFIHLWDAKTLRERAAWTPTGGFVMDLAYSADGRMLAAVCGGGLRLWDAGDDGLSNERKFPVPGAGAITNFFHLRFTTDKESLLAWDAGNAVTKWRLTKGEPEQDGDPFPGPKDASAFAVSADGRTEAYCRPDPGTGKYKVCVKALFDKQAVEKTAEVSSPAGELVLSADGKRLAARVVSLGGGELCIWDLAGGEPQARKPIPLSSDGAADFQSSLTFMPDGNRVVFAVHPRTRAPAVWLYDATTGEGAALEGLDGPATHLSFAADGKLLAVVGRDHRLHLWEDDGAAFVPKPCGPAAAGLVRRLAFRPESGDLAVVSRLKDKDDWQASQSDQSNLIVWDWPKLQAREVFTCGGWFGDCAYTPDGARLYAGGAEPGKAGAGAPFRNGFLRVWRADSLKEEEAPKLPLEMVAGPVDAVAFDRDGKTLALLGGSEFARLACVGEPWPFRVRGKPFDVGRADSVALAPGGAKAAALGTRGQGFGEVPFVKWWDLRGLASGPPKEFVPDSPLEGAASQKAGRLTYSPDGKAVAALVKMGPFPGDAVKAVLWEVATGRTRAAGDSKGKHPPHVAALAFSPDGLTLATADADGRVTLWRADQPDVKIKEWEFPGPTTAVAFSPGGDYLAVGDGDGTAAVLKLPPK